MCLCVCVREGHGKKEWGEMGVIAGMSDVLPGGWHSYDYYAPSVDPLNFSDSTSSYIHIESMINIVFFFNSKSMDGFFYSNWVSVLYLFFTDLCFSSADILSYSG